MSHDGPAPGETSVFMHGVKPFGYIRVKDIKDKAKINEYDFLYADLLFPILCMTYYQ
jgi:hypothetical protein